MKARTFLEVVQGKFSNPLVLDKYPTKLHLLSRFYYQPFDIKVMANPIGEVCPVHSRDFSSMQDSDYDRWAATEQNILFKYWMKSEFGSDFTNVKDNCIYFQSDSYVIRIKKNCADTGLRLPFPITLDDFIGDCQRAGVELYWKDYVVRKYFK